MLITILVALILMVLALYLVQLLPIDGRISLILQIVVIVIAMLFIARAAGLG
jgi:hypothetical protein